MAEHLRSDGRRVYSRQDVEDAVKSEREACAKLCDAAHNDDRHGLDACDLAGHLADMIRLRAEQR